MTETSKLDCRVAYAPRNDGKNHSRNDEDRMGVSGQEGGIIYGPVIVPKPSRGERATPTSIASVRCCLSAATARR